MARGAAGSDAGQRLHLLKLKGDLLTAAIRTFDLPALLSQIKSGERWQTLDQQALAVFHEQRLRIVLMALHAGAVIRPHQVEGPISIQVLEGRIRFSTTAESATLQPGQMLTLPAQVQHQVEALEESAFLLTRITGTAPPEATAGVTQVNTREGTGGEATRGAPAAATRPCSK